MSTIGLTPSVYLLSNPHPGRVVEETWTRRAAAPFGPVWPREGASADGSLSCDRLGCLYRRQDRRVALVRDGQALAEDCRRVDLVVSLVPAHRLCRAGIPVIDRIDVWRSGAHAVWLETDRIRIEAVDEWRGDRPWVPKHRPKQQTSASEPRPRRSGEIPRALSTGG